MSGHSKWSTIKRQKGANDARRGNLFTKLGNAITIATKEGGSSPDSNFKLRLAIEAARAANMPKENINRAIDRGSGKGSDRPLEEITYEAYGPEGIALLIQTVTDNKQRTGANIRSLIERSGGSLGGVGSVAWMFKPVGEIEVKKGSNDFDQILLASADLGAEDVEEAGSSALVYTNPQELESIKQRLVEKGFEMSRAELTQKPTNIIRVEDKAKARQILELMDRIEDMEDVQRVYANFDVDEKVLQDTSNLV